MAILMYINCRFPHTHIWRTLISLTTDSTSPLLYCNAYFLMYVYLCDLSMHPEQAKRGLFSDKGGGLLVL